MFVKKMYVHQVYYVIDRSTGYVGYVIANPRPNIFLIEE